MPPAQFSYIRKPLRLRVFVCTKTLMDVEFHPPKDQDNRAKHGMSLALAADFDFHTALIDLDTRRDYGEDRMIGVGFIADRLVVLIFVETETGIRAISLRKAERHEAIRYAQEAPPA